jgi:hypothetical protein
MKMKMLLILSLLVSPAHAEPTTVYGVGAMPCYDALLVKDWSESVIGMWLHGYFTGAEDFVPVKDLTPNEPSGAALLATARAECVLMPKASLSYAARQATTELMAGLVADEVMKEMKAKGK